MRQRSSCHAIWVRLAWACGQAGDAWHEGGSERPRRSNPIKAPKERRRLGVMEFDRRSSSRALQRRLHSSTRALRLTPTRRRADGTRRDQSSPPRPPAPRYLPSPARGSRSDRDRRGRRCPPPVRPTSTIAIRRSGMLAIRRPTSTIALGWGGGGGVIFGAGGSLVLGLEGSLEAGAGQSGSGMTRLTSGSGMPSNRAI